MTHYCSFITCVTNDIKLMCNALTIKLTKHIDTSET